MHLLWQGIAAHTRLLQLAEQEQEQPSDYLPGVLQRAEA